MEEFGDAPREVMDRRWAALRNLREELPLAVRGREKVEDSSMPRPVDGRRRGGSVDFSSVRYSDRGT
jgi:hypothetical protein